jgi:CheY-like chemotaxis protein
MTFARKTDASFEPLNLEDLIQELFSMLQQTFPKIITFKKIFPKDIPFILADRTQIHQSLLNLCVNARDAMPHGGSIIIKVEKQTGEQLKVQFPTADQDSYICISVTDSGEGMNETTRGRVFEPFFTTKAKGKGTGLGLSVVYGVVQSHHGFINVESELGYGTTFRLYFPIPNINEKPVDSRQVKSFEIGGTETILLVEDEELLIEMVSFLLESKGYKVFVAQDGAEAIEVYKKHIQEIALVLTDMGLPTMTGMEEFKKLKEIDPNVKVILASGYFEPDMKADLLKAGAKGFLQKPYMSDVILQTLREVLDKKSI